MRFWFFVLIYLVIHAGAQASASSRPEISVQTGETITVASGMPIQLRDLGAAGFVSADVMIRTDDLVIFEAMADQDAKTFTGAEFVRLVKEKIAANSDLAALRWTYFVPEQVKIKAVKNHLSHARISAAVLESLAAKCESCTFRLTDLKIPSVNESATITSTELETSPLKLAGSFLLPLRATFNTGETKIFYVTGQVTAKGKALVTSRSLQMGEKISLGDVKEQDIEINFSNDAFATADDLDGKTAGHPIQMGRAIYKSDLKRELVIQRGQMIRAVSGNDVFEVSVPMQAEDNGSVGDTIRLKNTETQKQMSGRVIDRGVVRVQ